MEKHYELELTNEKMGYITYLVRNGKITRKTARCLINRHYEVPQESMTIVKDLYAMAKYNKLNEVCDGITFREVGNHGTFPFGNKKKYNF